MVEGGMKCIKYLLFIFNLVFVIAGIGLIATGAYVKIKLDEYYEFFGNDYVGPGILLIVVGVIIFMLAFFGCCGAYKENYCLTMTFALLLIIIFILELAGGIAGFVLRKDIEDDVSDILRKKINSYNTSTGVKNVWDKLQREFDCCGVDNATDWLGVMPNMPPDSCCTKTPTPSGNCTYAQVEEETKGCSDALEDWIKDKIAIIGGVGIGLAFVQVVGIIFSCCLARAIRKEYEVV